MPNLYVFTAGSRSSKLIRFYAYRTQKLIHHAKFRAARYRTQSGACDAHADALPRPATVPSPIAPRCRPPSPHHSQPSRTAASRRSPPQHGVEREREDPKDFVRLRRANLYTYTPTYILIRFYGNLVHVHTYTLLRPKAQTYTQPPPYDSSL